MPILKEIFVTLLAIAFAGCSTTRTPPETRRLRLNDFSVSTPTTDPQAYHPPDVRVSPGMESTIPKYTGGGLIPVLVGAVIDSHVTGKQQAAFDADKAPLLPVVNSNADHPPVELVSNAVMAAVRDNGFLNSKRVPSSKSVLETRIVRFGLVRKGLSAEGEPELAGEIWIQVKLTLADGTTEVDRKFVGTSSDVFKMATLASEEGRIALLYDEASQSLVRTLGYALGDRYGYHLNLPPTGAAPAPGGPGGGQAAR